MRGFPVAVVEGPPPPGDVLQAGGKIETGGGRPRGQQAAVQPQAAPPADVAHDFPAAPDDGHSGQGRAEGSGVALEDVASPRSTCGHSRRDVPKEHELHVAAVRVQSRGVIDGREAMQARIGVGLEILDLGQDGVAPRDIGDVEILDVVVAHQHDNALRRETAPRPEQRMDAHFRERLIAAEVEGDGIFGGRIDPHGVAVLKIIGAMIPPDAVCHAAADQRARLLEHITGLGQALLAQQWQVRSEVYRGRLLSEGRCRHEEEDRRAHAPRGRFPTCCLPAPDAAKHGTSSLTQV